MNWSNVRLILGREIRDQLRDRRTLFMIAVLPLLLYPLLGMSLVQMRQFMREHATKVLVVGAKGLTDVKPPLFDNSPKFAPGLFPTEDRADLLEIEFGADEPRPGEPEQADPREMARHAVQVGEYDAALYFPPDFADRLEAVRQALSDRALAGVWDRDETEGGSTAPEDEIEVPSPEIFFSTATERSQLTFARLSALVERWREQVARQNLVAGGVPEAAARPFEVAEADVADQTMFRGAAVWSKILPVMLLLWALTGAFYPAIDLCAGEKERGTLETLLSSPAERSEIVLGKLLTVMVFSVFTAVLNLLAIGLTGSLLLSQMPGMGEPPLAAVVWLLVALVPVSALFSALCLALAALARSTKEGQYYLMPLLLITMPLAILPMAPGVELTLGNSLIPVTGVVLLLRTAVEGNVLVALKFLPPVLLVTLGCCLVAIRWAVDQFNSEKVLFRESERLDVGLWLRHLMQDRQPTPTVAAAVFCAVMILLLKFFMGFALVRVKDFAMSTAVLQLVVILTPALLMTVMFTSSPRQTLLLKLPRWWTVPAAAALAVALHPVAVALQQVVTELYPMDEALANDFKRMLGGVPNLGVLLFAAALLPAVCEELAFRGFILSGFRHLGHRWRAIIYTAVFFGVAHSILQQQIATFFVGVVIGFLAVQSGSILPGMVYHLCHNALLLTSAHLLSRGLAQAPLLRPLVKQVTEDGFSYRWPVVVGGAMGAAAILYFYNRLPVEMSAEEKLQAEIARAEADIRDPDSWSRADERMPPSPEPNEVAPCPAPGSEA